MPPPAVKAFEPMTSRHAERLVLAATGDTSLSFRVTGGRVPTSRESESDRTDPPNVEGVVPLPPPLPPERGERDEPHYEYEVYGAGDPGGASPIQGLGQTPSGGVGGGRAENAELVATTCPFSAPLARSLD